MTPMTTGTTTEGNLAMSEAIAEMVIPGTYIEVRSEGLISVGSIATGNIGIVGTAAKGPVNTVVPIGSFPEVLDIFGPADSFTSPAEAATPLTLTRALQQAFAGGAGNVFAVRIANGDPTAADADVPATGQNNTAFTLTAKSAGSAGNDIRVTIVDQGTDAPLRFRLVVTYGSVREVFEGNNVNGVRAALDGSTLVDVSDTTVPNNNLVPTTTPIALTGGTSTPERHRRPDRQPGSGCSRTNPSTSCSSPAWAPTSPASLLGSHLERTENEGDERIAIVGATASGTPTDVTGVLGDAGSIADDRIVLVAPGIKVTDAASGNVVSLPPAYIAALVAGMLSTLAPQISLTNKTVPIDGPRRRRTPRPTYKNLLQNRVLLVRKKLGFQVREGDHDRHRRVQADQRPPHRRLRQGGRPLGLRPVHRPAQQRAGARRAEGDARRLPLADGARRDARRLPARRERDARAGDRGHLLGHDDAAARRSRSTSSA